jgi:MFS family permease
VVDWPLARGQGGVAARPTPWNLGLDVAGAVGIGVTGALVSVLLPTIVRQRGVDSLGLAALAALPFVANMLSAYAGRFGPRTPRQLAAMRGVGAAALLVLLVAPLPPAMLVVVLVFMLSQSFSNPFQMRLWGALYPSRVLGRVLGVVGMSRASAAALAALAGGLIADRLGVPVVIAAAGLLGFASALAYGFQRAGSTDPPVRFSGRESLRALREHPALGRLALAQGFFGGGQIAAVPLYALVHVDRLHLSLAAVGLVGIAISAATTISYPVWGLVSDRLGPIVALRAGGVIGIASLAAYALAPSVEVLLLAAIALGVANASVDVGLGAFISAEVPLGRRSAAQAGWNAITGVRGIGAAFAGSALLSLGLVSVTGGLLLCAVLAAIGVVLFFRVHPAGRSAGSEVTPLPGPQPLLLVEEAGA